MFYVYILECADGSFYTGQTKDLETRLKQHRSGRGAKYVKGRLPIELMHKETYDTRAEAMRREIAIKKFSKSKKLELIDASN